MRDKAEKRRNDYLKAKKKERIYNSKKKEEDKDIRGFFGKLRKGKVPDLRTSAEIENEINSPKRSDKRRADMMDSQLDEYYKELLSGYTDEIQED